MDIVDVIKTKRDGHVLADDEIDFVIQAYTEGSVADEQVSALLMAILLNGMADGELDRWTGQMLASGRRLDLSELGRPTVDKHSTGGVGDKVSLVLCPLVAACGAAVPQLSGRGLGHTGGTLDKMEAIPGWSPVLDGDGFTRVLSDIGAAIVAAGDDLAPADKKLYALRDVTGTVESIPLIASSIMSKKIAEGTDALVLDVKVGSGAFMKDLDRARELAAVMVRLGEAHGVRTSALLTDMSTPLGRTAGNGLEVAESIATLQGGGPSDLVEVTVALAEEMVRLAGLDADPAEVLASGAAHDTWERMVAAQDGDLSEPLAEAREVETVRAGTDGVLTRLDAMGVGLAAWRLGAGRARKEDPVQAAAGVVWHATVGDTVRADDVLFELHTDTPERMPRGLASLEGAWTIEPDAEAAPRELLLDRVTASAT